MYKRYLPLFFSIIIFSFSNLINAQQKVTYIKAGKFFDGKSNELESNVVIKINGSKIESVGKNISIASDANVIDLSNETVMPGLIDCHTHVLLHPGDYDGQILRESYEYRAIYGVVNAEKTLLGGVTTVRDVGNEGAGFADLALRDAINNGLVPGPRMLVANQPITPTGGYDLVGYSPYFQTPQISYHADGPLGMRKEVRKLVKYGVDLIKIYMESYEKKQNSQDSLTGGINYTQEEVNALVDEAHRNGIKVAAHTYSDKAARMAIEAGVNSIEHGLYISEDTFKLMAEKNIYYVPTLLVYEQWRDSKIFGQISPQNKVKLTNTVEKHTASYEHALKTKVKIAFGTDTFEYPGTNSEELTLMVKYGMNPLSALKSATSVAADLLGIESETGTIEKGKAADIIAFSGDPLKDISVVEKVSFVMKEGKVYLNN
ncbi:MAG TPA: amidohydrolase family protein [Ignavibacteriaceae bacterium]|nr:amidohydrolase family protein [Ignavibacteriaceae bacterium]